MLIQLANDSSKPIYQQLFDEMRGRILRGQLAPAVALPSIRELSGQLGISPNTVVQTYRELEARGLVVARPGLGTYVASAAGTRAERRQVADEIVSAALQSAELNGISTAELIKAFRDADTSAA